MRNPIINKYGVEITFYETQVTLRHNLSWLSMPIKKLEWIIQRLELESIDEISDDFVYDYIAVLRGDWL